MQNNNKIILRYGLIFAVLNLIYTIYVVTYNDDNFAIAIATPQNIIGYLIVMIFYRGPETTPLAIGGFISGFLIGILIGWIYGEIKNEKRSIN